MSRRQRFAILNHDWPTPHKDLLLESTGVLLAWRLPAEFEGNASRLAAVRLPDHRLLYLTYEGAVSGDRGEVRRWDAGDVEWLPDDAGRLLFQARGSFLIGRYVLEHLTGDDWILSRLSSDLS